MAVSFIITVNVSVIIVKQVQLGCEFIVLHGIIIVTAVWA